MKQMKKLLFLSFVGLLLLSSVSMLSAQSAAKTQPELTITTLAENNNAMHADLVKESVFPF
jgi:ABC-type glycerol-3-phosphate transport system substrate-binding protein